LADGNLVAAPTYQSCTRAYTLITIQSLASKLNSSSFLVLTSQLHPIIPSAESNWTITIEDGTGKTLMQSRMLDINKISKYSVVPQPDFWMAGKTGSTTMAGSRMQVARHCAGQKVSGL